MPRKVTQTDKLVSPILTFVRYRESDMERLFRSPLVRVDIASGAVLAWKPGPWVRREKEKAPKG